jgi:tetraacyldisaccharide 4'-kinase
MQEYLHNLATDREKGLLAGIFKVFLFALSLLYGLIVRILIFINRLLCRRLNVKVISIGNITLGGTGKTSLVEYIAGYLKSRGHKVAILSRGYKRRVTKSLSHQVTSSEAMGDEPYMLSGKLGDIPVLVDADRIRAAHLAMRDYGVDTVILDDGLQQWRIKKDLEIVAIDATNPLGNRHLLPRGILREPLSGLRRAHVFVLTKTNLKSETSGIKDFLKRINPAAAIIESCHEPLGFYKLGRSDELLNVEALKGKSVTLFCGIGDPDSFENLIARCGIKIGLSFRFRDHHRYTQKDLEKIVGTSRDKNIDTIITTEKDAARLISLSTGSWALTILVLRIRLIIARDEQRFHNRLLQLYPL